MVVLNLICMIWAAIMITVILISAYLFVGVLAESRASDEMMKKLVEQETDKDEVSDEQ